MAKILDFVRRPTAPAAPAGGALATCLEDFSIEVMPRTAAKVADFRAILPAGTRVYLAHIDGTDFAEMLAAARRLADEGFAVMPHFPARGIAAAAELDARIAAYADVGVRAGAGDRRRHRPPARPLHRGDAAPAHRPLRRPRLHPTCTSPATPRATATSTPPAATPSPWPHSRAKAAFRARPTPRWRSPPSSASRPPRSIAWADRLARRRHHPAGPHRRRRPRQAADPAQVRHVLRRRPVASACCSAAPPTSPS